jgi:hypothetical protein
VVNLKESIVLAAHRHRASPKVFHPILKAKSSSTKTKLSWWIERKHFGKDQKVG